MNVRLESMCQGDGKIYAQIAIERLSADSIVTLEAHLKMAPRFRRIFFLSIRSTGSLQRTS